MYSISPKIDVFDSETNSWSVSQLYEPKTGHAAIAVNQKIFWAGGAKTSYQGGYPASNVVEIKDVVTGVSTLIALPLKQDLMLLLKIISWFFLLVMFKVDKSTYLTQPLIPGLLGAAV